jgi:5-methylphenazine-1-carboxylate 1-monooxygenase
VFYNRFGQLIYTEPAGRDAGSAYPQYSIHRGDLQSVLLSAVRQRIGAERVLAGWRCTGVEQDATSATANFEHSVTGENLQSQRADIVVACDGLHSIIRKQLHPTEGEPVYSGVNMWRGATVWPKILSGASMIRAGWFTHGKLVVHPIRDNVEDGIS